MNKTLLFSLIIFLFQGHLFAQNDPAQPKKRTFVDAEGRFYQQASLPTYIMVATSPDEKPTVLNPIKQKQSPAPKAIYLDGHGKHLFHHYNSLTRQEDIYEVYADGLAPVSVARFAQAPVFVSNNNTYYGKNLAISLTFKDEMSGINQVFHTLNEQPFSAYTALNIDQEGKYSYRFFATDNVGNAEKVNSRTFTVDLSAPKTYFNIVGINTEKVISVSSKIYLTREDSLSGVARTFYRFDEEPFRPYLGGNIAFQYLPDGDHALEFYSTDHVTNKETESATTFYLDKTAPLMSADVLGDRFVVGNKIYFSGRTKLKLTAVDNKSGIKEVMYAVDNEPFHKYNDPFYLPQKAGLHTIRYYAIDNTQNITPQDDYQHSVGVVYVDLTGPALNYAFRGLTFRKGDTLYLNTATQVNLAAFDPESGLNRISYSIDGQTDEIPYKQPFSFSTGGLHTVDYFGYDNVNNRNVGRFIIIVDDKAPDLNYQFSVAAIAKDATGAEIYPSYTTLYLASSDTETGSNAITYNINGSAEILYAKPITGLRKNTEYLMKVSVYDKVGNKNTQEIKFKTGKY
jgi:hypothetical protein